MIILISNILGITKYKNNYFKISSIIFFSLLILSQIIIDIIYNNNDNYHIYLLSFKILSLVQYIYFSIDKNIINYFNDLKSELSVYDNIIYIITNIIACIFYFTISISYFNQYNILTLITNYILLVIYLTVNHILLWILKKNNIVLEQLLTNINNNIKLEELTLDILTCKYNYEIMIYNIQNCFSLLVFIGLTNIYFLIKFIFEIGIDYNLLTPFIFTIILIINLVMIQKLIQKVAEIKHNIVHNIKKQGVIKKYLFRNNNQNLINPNDNNFHQKLSLYNLSNDIETGRTIDWIAFNQIIDSSWRNLEFCGYEWDSTELIKKTLWFIWIYLLTKELF